MFQDSLKLKEHPVQKTFNAVGELGALGLNVPNLAKEEFKHDWPTAMDQVVGTALTTNPVITDKSLKTELATPFLVFAMPLVIATAMELPLMNCSILKLVVTARATTDGKHHQMFLAHKPSAACPHSATQAAMTLPWKQNVVTLHSTPIMASRATMGIRKRILAAKSATGMMIWLGASTKESTFGRTLRSLT